MTKKKIIKKRFWIIDGWDSTDKIFHLKVSLHVFSESKIITILQILTDKYSLNDDEIIKCFIRGNKNSLLEVKKEPTGYAFYCGANPHFSAKIIEE